MGRMNKIGTAATSVKTENGVTTVRYHQTDVVEFTDTTIILRTGGWKSVTTKARMNQTSNVFDLGYGVFQKDRIWFVDYNGKTEEFVGDEFVISRV